MAALETVQTATATSTAMDDSQLNANSTEPTNINVFVALKFRGVTFDPTDLYAALDAKWGTVSTNMDQPSRNNYEFTITP